MSLPTLLLPFRLQPPAAPLRPGYRLLEDSCPAAADLNRLLLPLGEQPRSPERWQQVLARSSWHLAVVREPEQLVGFVRVTSDMALNANLWDLAADPGDTACGEIYAALVSTALARLRRDLSGCSISLAAPPAAQRALEQHGFIIDPGGIRAMGLRLR